MPAATERGERQWLTSSTAPTYDALEAMIDRHGLSGVLKGMADICYEKQEHVESNWQDRALGKAWAKAARLAYSLSKKKEMKLP